jgi:Fe2+ or Zn2+ uptake regulation protein
MRVVRSPDALTELFRGQGLKITPQRQCIFRALDGNEQHPSAEAIYDTVRSEMPAISLRTVYQTLNDLVSMGEIDSIDLGTGATRFDPNIGDHHHLVCDGCGAVVDVEIDVPASGIARPAEELGFEVARTEIVFRGRCVRCATSGISRSRPT